MWIFGASLSASGAAGGRAASFSSMAWRMRLSRENVSEGRAKIERGKTHFSPNSIKVSLRNSSSFNRLTSPQVNETDVSPGRRSSGYSRTLLWWGKKGQVKMVEGEKKGRRTNVISLGYGSFTGGCLSLETSSICTSLEASSSPPFPFP
jgi:hypothetical protein